MQKGIFAVAALAAMLAFPSSAGARPIRCDTCYDDATFRAEAERAGQGTHIVFNLDQNLIQQWYIGSGGTGGGGNPEVVVSGSKGLRSVVTPMGSPTSRKENVPPGATEELRRAHELYVIGGASIRPIIVVPIAMLSVNPDVKDKTAYEYVLDRNMQAQVETAAGRAELISAVTGANVITALAELTNLASSQIGLRDQAALLFKIVFKDGSYIIVRVDLDHANGATEPNSARTAGGQAVPATIDEVSGTWSNYNGENLAPMVTQMQILGATISYVGGQNHGSVQTISCYGTGAQKVCAVKTEVY